MVKRLQRPLDPYSPLWVEFRRQNPGLKLSLSAGSEDDDGGDFDFAAFLPEQFHGEDGAFDTDGFRASYDELVTFKAQSDEARSALPEEATGYEFALPENYTLPEGFDPTPFEHKDDDGNEVKFDPASMIQSDDPDIPQLQSIMHRIGQGEVSPVEATKELAGLFANRELRGLMAGHAEATEQKKALGPDANSRINTISRTLQSRLPEAQAKSLLDSITTADALRAVESLVKTSKVPPPAAPSGKDLDDMSNEELIAEGLKQSMAG